MKQMFVYLEQIIILSKQKFVAWGLTRIFKLEQKFIQVEQFCIAWKKHISPTTGISLFSVCAKTHRKMRIPSEKYFSIGVPSEKYPQKYNDRKITFFCEFTVRNNFSVGLTRTEKLFSPRLKLIFLCVNPHRKKK